jgi:hypothetical protein
MKVVSFFGMCSTVFAVNGPHIKLAGNLEEPDTLGFCIDLPGWGENVRFEQLHVHTYKTGDGRDLWFHPYHDADAGIYRIKGGAGGDAEGK